MFSINGIIVINKEKGFTSHDAVAVMRKILGTKKVGHTGTLDPEATGVLPICIGKGTKVSDMLTNSDKEYVARVTLGKITDTEDIWGEVIEENDASHITEEMVKDAVKKFIGEIEQIPPMYSAIKINGKKLYEYARKGIEVERKSRIVTIKDIDVFGFKDGSFNMRVACSKGTYIRTLCHDLGASLGVGACMSELTRTKSSVFTIENALTLDQIKEKAEAGKVKDIIVPVDALFSDLEKIVLTEDYTAKILNGMFLNVKLPDGKYRVYGFDGAFVCVGQILDGTLKIVKNFYAG